MSRQNKDKFKEQREKRRKTSFRINTLKNLQFGCQNNVKTEERKNREADKKFRYLALAGCLLENHNNLACYSGHELNSLKPAQISKMVTFEENVSLFVFSF